MGVPIELLSQFQSHVQALASTQAGNFIDEIKAQFPTPTEPFLHRLCRKIDIKGQLFVAYDDLKDLRPTSDEQLDDNNWLKIIWILAYFGAQSDTGIRYKAINTLLKVRDAHPSNHALVEQLYALIEAEL
ncbi:MAG: hypothetical protein MJ218_01695 [Opitutales bacterium]|nr:hypothetical protein [Opitutales bacterium]